MKYNAVKIEDLPLTKGDRFRVLLVSNNVKPASTFDLYKFDYDPQKPDSWRLSEREEAKLEERLSRLGLSCLRKKREIVIAGNVMSMPALYYGKDQNSLNRLLVAQSDYDVFIAHGHPVTAVEAFVGLRKKHNGTFPETVRKDTLLFYEFGNSEEYWKDELKTGELWADTVRMQSPVLYDLIMHSRLRARILHPLCFFEYNKKVHPDQPLPKKSFILFK